MEHLKFPIGKVFLPSVFEEDRVAASIAVLRDFPTSLSDMITSMDDDAIDRPYRPGGWTGRQVVHHIADSHMQALTRIRWALTEDSPTIKAYDEVRFAEMTDYALEFDSALAIIKGVHHKMVHILSNLSETEMHKGFFHPATQKFFTMYQMAAMYDWHARHHLAHLQLCKEG